MPEAEFESEDPEFLVGTEGFREGFPVYRFDHVVVPVEAIIHVVFQESESVLSSYGRAEFTSDSTAGNIELYMSRGEEWDVFARSREVEELVSS